MITRAFAPVAFALSPRVQPICVLYRLRELAHAVERPFLPAGWTPIGEDGHVITHSVVSAVDPRKLEWLWMLLGWRRGESVWGCASC